MDDKQKVDTEETTQNSETQTEDTAQQENQWDAVAKDFQALGETMAGAIKSAWTNESTQSQVKDLKHGLQNMADQVGHALDEAKDTINNNEVKGEFKKATTEVKDFGGKVYSESKPFFLDVLKSINAGIASMIDKLEPHNVTPTPDGPVDEPPADEAVVTDVGSTD